MLPGQLFNTLKARWRGVLLTWLILVGVVVAVSLALPARYEATATVLVEINGTDPIHGREVFKPAGAVSTYVATQVDVLKSEEVGVGAARLLGMHNDPKWQDAWRKATQGEGSFESWLAGGLLRRLDVRPSRDSNVLTVGYTSPDPQHSAAVANAFVQSYTDATLRMKVEPAKQFNAFFTERAKPLRQALDDAKARLSAYERQHGVVVGDDPDAETIRLGELTTQLVTVQDAAAEAANARRQAALSPRDMREVRNDPEVAALTAEVVRQEGRLTDLRSEFGEQHHAVVQARQSLADTRRRMDAGMKRAVGSYEAPVRVNYARVAEMQAAVERQRAVVQKRKAQRDAAAALLRDVENAQRAYDGVLTRVSQTALEGANTTQTTISVLKSATPPLWSPGFVMLNTLVASVLGLLLGIAYALGAERRDRRVRSPIDVTHWLQQPVLLVLPDAQARRNQGTGRADETRRRLVAPLPRLAAPK